MRTLAVDNISRRDCELCIRDQLSYCVKHTVCERDGCVATKVSKRTCWDGDVIVRVGVVLLVVISTADPFVTACFSTDLKERSRRLQKSCGEKRNLHTVYSLSM